MYSFIFTSYGKKVFQKLSSYDQDRILNKLRFFKQVPDIFVYAEKLVNFPWATHRLRVWDMRIILSQKSKREFYVADIWYRGDIYK